MNIDMFDRRRAERFAQLLDEPNGGPRRHARGQTDEQLAELVAIGHTLSAVRPAVQVDPEFRTGLRAMLVATADRDGMGEAAPVETAPSSHHVSIPEPRSPGLLGKGSARRIRARGAIVLGVAAGALAVSGISAASENAGPGDVLYAVKRSTERAQLAMAGSDISRGQLSLDFARTRLAEATGVDGDDPSFPDVLNDMDNDTRQGVRLLTTAVIAHKDAAPLATIEAFVNGQRRLLGPLLDRLDTNNRAHAMVSTGLLDDIVRRAGGLRSALRCDKDATAGADSLGPKPRACWVGSDATSPDNEVPGQGEQVNKSGAGDHGSGKSRTAHSTASPEPSTSEDATPQPPRNPTGANRVPPGVPTAEPTTGTPTTEPTDAPDEDRGLIGGITGGVVGG